MIVSTRPSRRILALIVIASIAIILLAIGKFYKPAAKSPLINIGYSATSTTRADNVALLDENGNGTADWKEMLLADTEESASSTENAPKTLSEGMARSIFASAVYLSQNGQKDISDDDKSALVDNLIEKIQSSFEYKEYSEGGLATFDGSDSLMLRKYANEFATLQVGMILQMNKNIPKIEQNVGVLAEIYDKQAKDLFAIKVPRQVADLHIEIVNNFSRAAAAFDAISHEKDDPLKLPLAITSYQKASTDQEILMQQVARFLRDNGIIFNKKEIGGFWNAFLVQ